MTKAGKLAEMQTEFRYINSEEWVQFQKMSLAELEAMHIALKRAVVYGWYHSQYEREDTGEIEASEKARNAKF